MGDTPPPYFTDQSVDAIHSRMAAEVDPLIGVGPGSHWWNATRPAAVVLRMAGADLRTFHARSWVSTATGADLDERVGQAGVTRRAAVKAGIQSPNPNIARITGVAGTIIPAETILTTSSTLAAPGVRFLTPSGAAAVIPGPGILDLEVVAEAGGAAGNIPIGALAAMAAPISGVTGVTNLVAFTGGLDIETDEELRARYYVKVRSPSAGGNIADYQNWALEVPGVGGVSVIPHRDGGGTVSLAIIDSADAPADQALVDATQEYIAPPLVITRQAEDVAVFVASGPGVAGITVDATRADDIGDSRKLAYNAGGYGRLTWSGITPLLVDPISAEILPGVYQFRCRIVVDDAVAGANILSIGVWNVSAAAWAKTRPGGVIDALVNYDAGDLSETYREEIVEFYANAADTLQIIIDRLSAEAARIVWLDQGIIRGTFSMPTGQGRAPVNHRVTVEGGTPIAVALDYTATYAAGYTQSNVDDAIEAAYQAHIRGLAFMPSNDVTLAQVGNVILGVDGVLDYDAPTLLLNGVNANVAIAAQEVAVPGVVTPH